MIGIYFWCFKAYSLKIVILKHFRWQKIDFGPFIIIIIIMKSFISDPEQVRVTFFQSYIHYRYKKLFFTVFEYILWDILWSLSGSVGAKSPQKRGYCCLTPKRLRLGNYIKGRKLVFTWSWKSGNCSSEETNKFRETI